MFFLFKNFQTQLQYVTYLGIGLGIMLVISSIWKIVERVLRKRFL